MFYILCLLFIFFIIYSFLGYITEVLNVLYLEKKFTLNRGFMLGPIIPIFGVGAIVLSFCLQKYKDDSIALFILSAVICSVVEYYGSWLLEKLFKLRWWDYSNFKYNINGRICLINSVLFGLAGLIIVRVTNPILYILLNKLNETYIEIIAVVLFILFVVDLVISIVLVTKIKVNFDKFRKKDATSEIKKEIKLYIENLSLLDMRIFKAFPNITSIIDNVSFSKFKNLLFKTRIGIQKRALKLKRRKFNKKIKEEIKSLK